MTNRFRIEALGSHDRSSFGCGVPSLDQYFHRQVTQDMKRLVSSCFVLMDNESDHIAGYYTLAATSILAEEIAADVLRKLPRYPVLPAALVGRLAIDRSYHRQGLGSTLIADAALRVLSGDLKAFAVVVDAKDDDAAAFYKRQGFRQLFSRPMSFFLPLATIRKATLEN